MRETWTISELAERAASLLESAGPVNGRVREVPNERLIRWYTTIGLLDPPLARRGRIALYGRRHLLQLVAVKRRQADGLSIAAIQAELTGATDAMLVQAAHLTGLPDASGPPDVDVSADGSTNHSGHSGVTVPGEDDPGETGRERFWTRPAPVPPPLPVRTPPPAPAPAGTPLSAPASPVTPPPGPVAPSRQGPSRERGVAVAGAAEPLMTDADVVRHASGRAVSFESAPADVVYGVRLAPGVTVTVDAAGRPVTSAEARALREAAEPLLSMLARLGLTDRSDHPEGMTP
jgi:DNA-binding transcriptional MerR regulator